jgi:hypothetical protein
VNLDRDEEDSKSIKSIKDNFSSFTNPLKEANINSANSNKNIYSERKNSSISAEKRDSGKGNFIYSNNVSFIQFF